jgi:hypothetical protein
VRHLQTPAVQRAAAPAGAVPQGPVLTPAPLPPTPISRAPAVYRGQLVSRAVQEKQAHGGHLHNAASPRTGHQHAPGRPGQQAAAQARPAGVHAPSRASVIQRALGFEIELAVLIDKDGEAVPEKTPVALYGDHLALTVDENASLDTVVPADAALTTGTPRRYASILEIVTRHYSPETTEGRTKILAAIDDAIELANRIDTGVLAPRERKALGVGGKLKAHPSAPSGVFHLGNASQPGQTTDASFQATFGLELAQIGAFFKSLEYQQHFVTKHHSDTQYDEGARVRQEMAQARKDADAVMKALGWEIKMTYSTTESPGHETRGLLVLILQYLRMGRYFYDTDGSRKPLEKNIVNLLSRTDLAQIYKGVTTPEKFAIDNVKAKVMQELLAKSGRGAAKALFNDTADSQIPTGTSWSISCQKFLENIFAGVSDGVTSQLSGFTRRPAEKIDPEDVRGRLFEPMGPVFELRNIATPPVASSLLNAPAGRIPRSQWKALATYLIDLLKTLNTRSESDQSAFGRTSTGPVTSLGSGLESIQGLDWRSRLKRTSGTVVRTVGGSSQNLTNLYG